MRVLLDTHILVWAESLDERLGPEARRLLLDARNELLVSPVSSLELSRLIALGRFSLRKPLGDWLDEARRNLGYSDAPFTHRIAIGSYELPGAFHKDPADRMLVATARQLDYTLLTADEAILGYPDVKSRDARK